MKNVITRSISGIAYIAIIVAALLLGPWYFTGLCCLFAVLGILELSSLLNKPMIGTLTLIDALGAVSLAALPLSAMIPEGTLVLYCCLCFIPACFIIRTTTALYDIRPTAFSSAMMSMASVVYLGLPLLCLNFLYANAGWQLVISMFAMIWINDTGAFCCGSLFGKHKMSPRLSPKKTWEGLVGGILLTGASAVGGYFIFRDVLPLSLIAWIFLGLLIGVFSTWGDLFESLMKRSLGVKDSGHLIPGHGGILDRIDSLLFVAPFTLLYFFFAVTL